LTNDKKSNILIDMSDKTEKKRLAILRILHDTTNSLSSPRITQELNAKGFDVSERTVRLYLLEMDSAGLTENFGKKGRRITDEGLTELSRARVFEKIGFMAAKIDQMTYKMDFRLSERSGTVVMNTSIIEKVQIKKAVSLIKSVFASGFGMGELVTVFGSGQRMGEWEVEEGFIGIGTVCSVTLNGVLLSVGIPTNSRFGGLLELDNGKPIRFVEIINYDGTTLDPLEVFISSGMADLTGATESGSGRIGASFREVPADSRDRIIELSKELKKVGLDGFLTIGWPGQALLDIPVSDGRCGVIIIGGLNPVSILEEHGIHVKHAGALSGLCDYRNFFHYNELDERVEGL
jgi:HTH-type transcriptional regulator, global nitrogen regulator NrpRI